MEMKLEVVLVPVSDVDRAKAFYEGLGWRMDIDYVGEEAGFRVVQFTPPGSECSIIIGEGITAADPGSYEGLQLTVTDIVAAREDLVGRGHRGLRGLPRRGRHLPPHRHRQPDDRRRRPRTPTTAPSPPSATLTATAGCCRKSTPGRRAAERVDREDTATREQTMATTTSRRGAGGGAAARRRGARRARETDRRRGRELARLVRRVHGRARRPARAAAVSAQVRARPASSTST